MVLLPLLLFVLQQMLHAMENSALYRNPPDGLLFANFAENSFHYLWAEKITSSKVANQIDCTFMCVGEPKCNSLNVAAYPDSKGLFLCELLATDKYRATEKFHANATFHHYNPRTPCESNPCKFGADCIPDYKFNSYRCQCKPGFTGKNGECAASESCSVIKLRNPKAPTGSYIIDPDGEGGVTPFTVHCDMTDKKNIGVTVISHDSEDKMEVAGFEEPGCYVRDIHYTGADLLQLGNLTAISAHCEQFIKYDCRRSMLLRYNNESYGWWVSRDGDKMTYWGGSNSSFPYKCACGVTGTCADPADGCNCNSNDDSLREDSGLLTDKSRLPVKQLKFGDTGYPDESGNHTLGKLKCYGVI